MLLGQKQKHICDNSYLRDYAAVARNNYWRLRLSQVKQISSHIIVYINVQKLPYYFKKHTKYTRIHTNESTHSDKGPVRQNPIRRTVRTAHASVFLPAQLQYTIQHRTVLIISSLTSRQTS